jgi:hypothetical protein
MADSGRTGVVHKSLLRLIRFVRSLSSEAAALLFVVATGFAFVLASTAYPLMRGKEAVKQQDARQSGKASKPPESPPTPGFAGDANDSAAVDEEGNTNADGGRDAIGDDVQERVIEALVGTSGLLAAAAFFFLALGTALSALGANLTRQSSRAHVLLQLADKAGALVFVVHNLGPTLASLRGYRMLPVEEGFDPRQFERCGATDLKPLHRSLQVGKDFELPVWWSM